MLDGLFMLLALSVVMALASFLAGALPLSVKLSSSQLRLISTIGMGVLVGTSLVVIIPEGIEAVYSAGEAAHGMHTRRQLRRGEMEWVRGGVHNILQRDEARETGESYMLKDIIVPGTTISMPIIRKREEPVEAAIATTTSTSVGVPAETPKPVDAPATHTPAKEPAGEHEEDHDDPPTFYIGFALIVGFILMFLIDKLPRHASDHITPPPPTRHISLDNLGSSSLSSPDQHLESESFLQSLTPTPKQSRSLATTTGLVIHAAADGIAMGASASSSNTKLGFIIFLAIMVHKAPAAFGLTSVLLKQGLSKRAARGHLIIFSLAAPFGALSTWLIVSILGGDHMEGPTGQWWTGMLLLFSGGTFLYVAMHAMQEDSNHDHGPERSFPSNGYADLPSDRQRKQAKPQIRDTLAAVGGMLIPLLTQIGHHH